MAGYKGYRLERRERGTKSLLSPTGADVAIIFAPLDHTVRQVLQALDGLVVRDNYKDETEIVKDLADQHLRLEGVVEEDRFLAPNEARLVITGTVNNLQVNQNALGVQITGDQLQQINEAVDHASPDTLKEIIKTWIPQVVSVGAGLATLLKALGIGGA